MYGLLNINKPPGKTSRDAVNRVQRLVRPVKVGHAGTLDPLATGVLVICLGPATRLIQYVQQLPKRYTGTFLLGRHSDSDDLEGEVIELANPVVPTADEVIAALPRFVGTIQQRPPIFSAIKVNGKRAYDLARAGKDVQLQARPVAIHELRVVRYEYPELVLDIGCGSGTYIRSLGRDLGESLGTAAVMSSLERTAIGDFTVESAIDLNDLTDDSLATQLIPAEAAIRHLDCVVLSSDEVHLISNGRTIERPRHGFTGDAAAMDAAGHLVAIVAPRTPDHLRPVNNLAVASKHARTTATSSLQSAQPEPRVSRATSS
ncbi:MAG: tRNA pseudouridine(55) synthase TruB [Planctomycetota bacterium]|nr:tRNA pseudouridine(55) synthase TruB [Planctomycetota bacterium]